MDLKLGKLPATKDDRDLKLSSYIIKSALPLVPKEIGHEDRMPLPRLMLGNGPDDTVRPGFQGAGNCVFAGAINVIRLAAAIAGKPIPPFTGKEAIDAYSEVTGYVIGDDSTDNGTDMRTALNWWRKTGIADADGVRHKLGAFAGIDPLNYKNELEALYVLDIGNLVGIQFPSSAMNQFNAGKSWSLVKGAKNEGGHCILWDAHRKFEFVETWAKDQPATASFMKKQVDEAWALFLPDALVDGKTQEGLNVAQLQADIKAFSTGS